MKLYPIRLNLWLGELRVLGLVMFDQDVDEQPEVVSNTAQFGFQIAADGVDEVNPNLNPWEEDEDAAP